MQLYFMTRTRLLGKHERGSERSSWRARAGFPEEGGRLGVRGRRQAGDIKVEAKPVRVRVKVRVTLRLRQNLHTQN